MGSVPPMRAPLPAAGTATQTLASVFTGEVSRAPSGRARDTVDDDVEAFVGTDQAEFLAAVQVIVYAGAIVVLFLFVIMLLGVDRIENLRTEPIALQRWVAGLVGLALAGLLVATALVAGDETVVRGSGIASAVAGDDPDANVRQIAGQIFGDYVVAFELTSVLLVVAVVGTVVMARRKRAAR